MIKEAYLDYTARIITIHTHDLTAQHLLAPEEASYGPRDTPHPGMSSKSWCSVSSSGHAGLSFVPLQRAGGDHSLCYDNHLFQCSIARCVELCFAQVGQPVQMPGAAHWIPRTSELLLHGLLLWDLGLSHPLWVSLRTKRDLANLRIWTHFCALIFAHFRIPVENIQLICKILCEVPLQMTNLAWQQAT